MSHLSSHPLTTLGVSGSLEQALPPQLPPQIEVWSTRALAAWLDVSTSTVKYHARQAFRGHSGRWELSREQAQRVVNRISHFGQVGTLNKPDDIPGSVPTCPVTTGSVTPGSVTACLVTAHSNLCSEPATEGELKKIERLLNGC